ncbi:nitrate reductase [Deefgea rivuli]|uniref:nitrate reductase n=1 Tax=Deefgea rivuli TaxID=400948 RepID=UPI0004817EBA|nr:nitrate reductase [Deefgea rivuli]
MSITRSTCCYCGVGCGVLIESDGLRITGIQGDPEHPANFGRLCTKGLSLAKSAASLTNRALYPELRLTRDAPRERVDWSMALDTVAERFADIIEQHGPDAVAFYVSGQLLTEDYYVFNKLAKGLVGTNNIDTNSRLCMSSAVTGYKMALGADGPPTCYDDLELAQTVLFAGSNMAYAHPVLFRRLEAAKAANPAVKWIVIDPRRTDTAVMADLHLQIQPGTDVALFNGMLHHLLWEGLADTQFIAAHTVGFAELKTLVRDYTPKMVAEICGILEEDLRLAAEWFGASPAALSLYCMGLNQSSHGTDKNLSLINLHLATGQIGKPGAGPFSLTGQPNAMGGREVGGMATMLAAHREIGNAAHRAEISALWGVDSVSDRPGLPAIAMFDAIKAGKIKAVWIVCSNPAHSLPDLANVRLALEAAELVVVQDAFANTDTVAFADVLLPASSWGEKSGTVTNSERRISRVNAAVATPGEAKADWEIAVEVARRIEARLRPDKATLFPYAGGSELAREMAFAGKPASTGVEMIFNEHRLLTMGRDLDIGGLTYAKLEQSPQQWPFPAGATQGQARRYTDGVFAMIDGKARFHAVQYLPVAEATNSRFPFHLLTGRLRDQWHGMSRTGRVPQLFEHSAEPSLTMHPLDAERRSLKAGDLLKVASKRGNLILPLEVSDSVASGTVFAAMHWNGQFLNSGGINEVCSSAVDGKSAQPELKHAAVRVEKAELPWRLVAAMSMAGDAEGDILALHAAVQPLLQECAYASITLQGRENPMLVLRVADVAAPTDSRNSTAWLERLFAALNLQPGADVLQYQDAKRGLIKRVAWSGDVDVMNPNVLRGFVLAGDIAGNEALIAQIGLPWTGPRMSVFAPRLAAPKDRVICNCINIRESTIRAEIAMGANVSQLKAKLGCGSVCGSCMPELNRLCQTTVV